MRRNRFARSPLRCARFERYEDRLVFSGLPWTEASAASPGHLTGVTPDWVQLTPVLNMEQLSTPSTYGPARVRDQFGFTGAGQTIAIIDSGVAWDHLALGGGLGPAYRVVGGWDFTEENDSDPYDDGPAGFHGTHVAGIIGSDDATRPGVAPEVDIVALRVFNDQGLGYTSWVEDALAWVHDHQYDFRYPITTVNLSLGTAWNQATPPAWATLEEELAQLAADDIFVAAAAGNSFLAYSEPGLAYPAASPYVVPVASVGDNGLLSSYSQRHARAIAAPGENIQSTVPDFIFGSDGNPNDWAKASGTSMATPYLAGASVLVRQALQFTTDTLITPTEIYQHLLDTADPFFDTATHQSYQRLNLVRAIESLLPADDYSSSITAPKDLGELQPHQAIAGHLARLDDIDAFRFTATATGTLSLEMTGTHPYRAALVLGGDYDAETINFSSPIEVSAGESYTLVIDSPDHLTDYEIVLSFSNQSAVTVHEQIVQAMGTQEDDTFRLWLDDQINLEVNGEQYQFSADKAWQFSLLGGGGSDQFSWTGSTAHGVETAVLRPGRADISAIGYDVIADGFAQITADSGGAAGDIVLLFGSTGDDIFTASPMTANMSGVDYGNRADGFSSVYAYAGEGDHDIAHLHDSIHDDQFVANAKNGLLKGQGYAIKASNFDRLFAYATAGEDTARLFDSPNDERFVATPDMAYMQGPSLFFKTWNFERVCAHASLGGIDVALFDGASKDDVFHSTKDFSFLRGDDYFFQAEQFSAVITHAGTNNEIAADWGQQPTDQRAIGTPTASVLSATLVVASSPEHMSTIQPIVESGHTGTRLDQSPYTGNVPGNRSDARLRNPAEYLPSVGAGPRSTWAEQVDTMLSPKHERLETLDVLSFIDNLIDNMMLQSDLCTDIK